MIVFRREFARIDEGDEPARSLGEIAPFANVGLDDGQGGGGKGGRRGGAAEEAGESFLRCRVMSDDEQALDVAAVPANLLEIDVRRRVVEGVGKQRRRLTAGCLEEVLQRLARSR